MWRRGWGTGNLELSGKIAFFEVSVIVYREQSGFAPQYVVLGHQITASRVYTRVKRFGRSQNLFGAGIFN